VWGIRDILVRYISGHGSESSDPYLCLSDTKGPKTFGPYVSVCGFGTLVHLHHSSKTKSHKEVTRQGFSYYFCLMTEGSGAGPGSVLVTNGSGCGSGRPKNIRILQMRIRIPNSACTFVDVLNAVLHVHNPALDLLLQASVVLHNVVLVLESLLFQRLSLFLHDTKLPRLLY
jgi:hypothetical protein